VRSGAPRAGARISVIETLKAAALWQPLRRREAADAEAAGGRLHIRPEDFRIHRFKDRRESVTIFVVDASGSAATARLAEAKGAIQLMLAEAYVRRDKVSLVTFRGTAAEVLLPPTRSLARAKRLLAALPGGGGTPLATALDVTAGLVEGILRRGGTPSVVVLSDGRANVGRGGNPGRAAAVAEAAAAARGVRARGIGALFIDTSPRGTAEAEKLAAALGARHLRLPYAASKEIFGAVRGLQRGLSERDFGR
jgi:magnesium chelatase subunit D